MFIHIFAYRLKRLLHDHENIFWTLVFPLILATFFKMAFSNLSSTERFNPIDIAVVYGSQTQLNESFMRTVDKVSSGDDRLFNLSVVTMEEADEMLKNNLISGYIITEWPIKLVVNKSGLKQTIIKRFIDNYMHSVSASNTILSEEPDKLQSLITAVQNRVDFVKEISASNAKPDNVVYYFYTLIAMTCMYGAFFGLREVSDIQAYMSPSAARINTAPVHKLRIFLYNSSASIIIHMTEMLIFLAYLIFILRIDFGFKTFYVLFTAFIGSLTGFFFGTFISAVLKTTDEFKVGVMISVIMICCFLSGMMYQDMKYIIARNMPVLSYINPVNLLTDAFYSLYYYDTFTRFFTNIAILAVFIAVFCTGTYLIIRRQKHASI